MVCIATFSLLRPDWHCDIVVHTLIVQFSAWRIRIARLGEDGLFRFGPTQCDLLIREVKHGDIAAPLNICQTAHLHASRALKSLNLHVGLYALPETHGKTRKAFESKRKRVLRPPLSDTRR